MHVPGCPAFSTVALAARQSRLRAARHGHHHLHHHYQRLPYRAVRAFSNLGKNLAAAAPEPPSNPSDGTNRGSNGLPSEVSPRPAAPSADQSAEHTADRDGASAASTTSESTTTGRAKRLEASTSLRNRLARKQDPSPLPTVDLPVAWKTYRVHRHPPFTQPLLPSPIVLSELGEPIVSRLYTKGHIEDGQATEAAAFFGRVVDDMIPELRMVNDHSLRDLTVQDSPDGKLAPMTLGRLQRVVRQTSRFLDAAWHLTDALAPSRQPEYVYSTRPFWWWHYQTALDPRSDSNSVHRSLHNQTLLDLDLDRSIAHSMPGLPFATFRALAGAVHRSFEAKAPPSFDAKSGQRPINILAMTGYSGKAIAESLALHIAHSRGHHCIQIDAQDLAVIVGGYLGQSLAYSRGSISTMGYRAAEANGKVVVDADSPAKRDDDDEGSDGASVINVRTTSLEDELQKIRQGNFDLFSKWDRLKIDNALRSIINASEPDRNSPNGTIIHLHDFVELNMTMEGSYMLSRLRAIVDAEWARGRKIVILGTSSVSQPSEEFQSMVRDLSASDLVMTRRITPESYRDGLASVDTLDQNMHNIEHMLWAMDPSLANASRAPVYYDGKFTSYFGQAELNGFLRERVLPLPEVFDLASSVIGHVGQGKAMRQTEDPLMGHRLARPLRQGLEEELHDEKDAQSMLHGDKKNGGGNGSKMNGIEASLDQYEKRIAVGWVSRDKVKTTFSDVHAPEETVSSLKLLTSLALTRPDAFQYGILAKNRITGCALYGPPGTGKTMLAKAVAHDTGANMLEISGASINDKWVGESEKLIRAVFTLAKKLSPCVVFIDEADAILASRSSLKRPNHRELINQFLKEWDGIQETTAFIMVATNRPWDLDEAVLRRLPRKILIDLPLRDDRAAILKLLLRDEQLAEDVSIDELADRSPWYSGSDLKAVCVTAAMSAVEEERPLPAEDESKPPVYPERRILRREHFDRALRQIPASINEDMDSLKHIRKFDQEYGSNRKKSTRKGMGFGGAPKPKSSDAEKIRPGP